MKWHARTVRIGPRRFRAEVYTTSGDKWRCRHPHRTRAAAAACGRIELSIRNAPAPTPVPTPQPQQQPIYVPQTPEEVWTVLDRDYGHLYPPGIRTWLNIGVGTERGTGASAGKDSAGMYLSLKTTSGYTRDPDGVIGHEFGHVWTLHHHFNRGRKEDDYLAFRGLLGHPKLNSEYTWSWHEIIAEDWRHVFGSAAAIAQRKGYMPGPGEGIAHPSDVEGLREFFLGTWAVAA